MPRRSDILDKDATVIPKCWIDYGEGNQWYAFNSHLQQQTEFFPKTSWALHGACFVADCGTTSMFTPLFCSIYMYIEELWCEWSMFSVWTSLIPMSTFNLYQFVKPWLPKDLAASFLLEADRSITHRNASQNCRCQVVGSVSACQKTSSTSELFDSIGAIFESFSDGRTLPLLWPHPPH